MLSETSALRASLRTGDEVVTAPTVADLLDEYDRYLAASPNLPERARLGLAERILRQIKQAASS